MLTLRPTDGKCFLQGLPAFLQACDRRAEGSGRSPREEGSCYRPLPAGIRLDDILYLKHQRRVYPDNTISYDALNAFPDNPDRVTAYGTINCVTQEPPLYQDWIEYCETVSGCVPSWCNDYIVIFEWAPNDPGTCGNVDTWKVAVPGGFPRDWRLEPLAEWMDFFVPAGGVQLPTIGDATGDDQYVYIVVNLEEYLASYPVTFLTVYWISNGESPDLPGYLIGTTPIVFDPEATEPFSTTRFTGELWGDGDVRFWPGGASATEQSNWGSIKSLFK